MVYHLLPPTTKKAAHHTSNQVNQNIRDKTVCTINTNKEKSKFILSDKIQELNYEWDTERVLETNAASVILFSSIMGLINKKRYWFLLIGTVGFFLLQHALQGWCPPLPVIRKLGVRTADEINNEKIIYKLLRQDFSMNTNDTSKLLNMAEKQ